MEREKKLCPHKNTVRTLDLPSVGYIKWNFGLWMVEELELGTTTLCGARPAWPSQTGSKT